MPLLFGYSLDRMVSGFKRSAFCAALVCVLLIPALSANAAMDEKDRAATLKAIQAASQRQWSYAQSQIANTRDPLAARMYYWMYYTEAEGPFPFNRISAFTAQVPGWPRQGALKSAAEKSMNDDTSPDAIINWFTDNTPQTVEGMERYMRALAARNQAGQMASVINGWWGGVSLTSDQQNRILRSYGKMITKDSHKRRFSTALSKGEYANARAIATLLGKGYPELAEARIALASGSPGVDSAVSRVPPYLQNDPGFALERLRWRRKKNMDFQAIELLHSMPDLSIITNPDDWWKERHILARRLMERKQYESAYLLVKKHGLKDGASYAEAEFLAGFLSLRYLKKPFPAFEHFENLYKSSTMPITKGRAAYWAGVASEALNHPEVAIQWFGVGANYPTVFYGQLCLAKLGRDDDPVMAVPPLPAPVRLAFENDDRIQIARLLHKAGDRKDASAFLRAYADDATVAEQFFLAAGLAKDWDQPNDSLAVAKKAQAKGVVLADYAFPTMLARVKAVDGEWALIHALIKQESAFDVTAQSPVGARGLMQLMPATAKETAQKMGIAHQTDWLVMRPDHNIRLGNAYIKRMIARFDGSYPLAIAAYNAGPGRVDQWIKQFGDPRAGDINMIDWIEMIPVAETRNYVQRVLEGVYIYRHKFKDLQNAKSPIHIAVNP